MAQGDVTLHGIWVSFWGQGGLGALVVVAVQPIGGFCCVARGGSCRSQALEGACFHLICIFYYFNLFLGKSVL